MFTRELRWRAAARPGAKRASPQGAAGRRAASVERLEGRVLLAFAPLGPEARVNTTTAGDQSNVEVAADADGDFVLVWQSDGQDGSGLGVYARRYAASGAALGGEFLVNTTTAGDAWARLEPRCASNRPRDASRTSAE